MGSSSRNTVPDPSLGHRHHGPFRRGRRRIRSTRRRGRSLRSRGTSGRPGSRCHLDECERPTPGPTGLRRSSFRTGSRRLRVAVSPWAPRRPRLKLASTSKVCAPAGNALARPSARNSASFVINRMIASPMTAKAVSELIRAVWGKRAQGCYTTDFPKLRVIEEGRQPPGIPGSGTAARSRRTRRRPGCSRPTACRRGR